MIFPNREELSNHCSTAQTYRISLSWWCYYCKWALVKKVDKAWKTSIDY